MEFRCVEECAECCVTRRYYPSKMFGKIGVLLLPEERTRIQELADSLGIRIRILPRVGVSERGRAGPTTVLAYQIMGADANGDTCPFLDTESGAKSPHDGLPCRIYEHRPLACAAYPLNGSSPVTMDEHCRFCQECSTADQNLESEAAALIKIRDRMSSDAPLVWRFATRTGEKADKKYFASGWLPDKRS